MIIFDQLRISDDGQKLYINARVNSATEFASTTIEKLYVCLGSQIYETLTIDPESNGCIYSEDFDNVTEINKVITASNLEYYNSATFKDLLFVFIKCANVPSTSVCYTAVGNYVLGVTFDENLLYQKVMGFTKQITDDCSSPSKAFIDFILLWNAFKAAVETEHYISAIKFYNLLFSKAGSSSVGITSNCNCHG